MFICAIFKITHQLLLLLEFYQKYAIEIYNIEIEI